MTTWKNLLKSIENHSENKVTPTQFDCWLEQQQTISPSFKKPLIMGVLNVTPNSFFDGGKFLSLDKACEHAFLLIEQGADIIDIGGESTKPYAAKVTLKEELQRIIPVIEKIRTHSKVSISVDTYKPEVMEAAVKAGANIINDVYALRQKGALAMAAKLQVPVCLMHMKGKPADMQENPLYPQGFMEELEQFFEERIQACEQIGIKRNLLILDPGFGFGKLIKNNLQLIYNLQDLQIYGLPILLGVSRKSTIGAILNTKVERRLIGSISIVIYAALKNAKIIRTHDVLETNQALQMIEAVTQVGEDLLAT